MPEKWIILLIDSNLTRLYIIKNLLEENDITAQIVNKSDSVYPTLGESELYVVENQQSAAFKLIESMQGRDNEWNESTN